MATLTQVRNKANSKLAIIWNSLQTRQDAYFAKHGKYFQLLAGSALTLDGADTSFSVISPSDEAHPIDIDYNWSDTVPFRIEVHEFMGKTKGYAVMVSINHAGTIYARKRDSSNIDTGWYQVIKEVLTPSPEPEPWPNLPDEGDIEII